MTCQSTSSNRGDAARRAHERRLLDAGALAAAVGAALAASLGAVTAAFGLLPFEVLPAAVLLGTPGAATGVLVASWRALFLEPPDTRPRPPRDDGRAGRLAAHRGVREPRAQR